MMNNWNNTADEKIIDQYLNGLEVPKDELTPIERMTLFSQGKEVDRLPCCLSTGETMAPLLNMSIDAYYHSAELMCQLEEYLFDNFRCDFHSFVILVYPHHSTGDISVCRMTIYPYGIGFVVSEYKIYVVI